MITLLVIMMPVCTYMLSQTLNPIKMSITLMIFSSAAFLSMYLTSGAAWFPMLFFMLFMGGILIIFMIISSVMPNEKILKSKMIDFVWVLTLALSSCLTLYGTNNSNFYSMKIKWIFNSSMNMSLIMMLIMIYFIVFVKMVSQEKMSLRSEACQ